MCKSAFPLLLLGLALAACAPATIPTAAPTDAPSPIPATTVPTTAPEAAATVTSASAVPADNRKQVDVFKVSDPTQVNLAAGYPQLVEFFAFW